VEFRLLGPFEVVVGGQSADLGGAKQRALLAMLAIHANEVISVDALIDGLWGDRMPGSAPNTLQGYVSRLRKALDPDGRNGAEPTIVFRAPGYVLTARPEQIDSRRFEQLVGEAEGRATIGDATEAASALRDALALWRGAALSDFAYEAFAQPEIVRLEELRLKAIEDLIDADLACGRHAGLVPDLEALVAEHPLRERFRAQLMVSLYRCGRQSEALSVYRDARQTFSEQLGVDPTPVLRDLERAILRHDPELQPPLPARAAAIRSRLPRRRWIAAGVGVTVAAALAVGFVLAARDPSAAIEIVPNSVAVVDAHTNEIVDDIRVGAYPGPVAAGNGSVWVGNIGDDTMTRIDTRTRKPSFPNGVQQPLDLAVTRQAVWIANGTSFATNPPTGGGTVERRGLRFGARKTIQVGPPETLNEWWTVVAADANSVWAGNASSRAAVQLDPNTGRVVGRVAAVGGGSIAVGYGSVWVAEYERNSVAEIDGRSGKVASRISVSSKPTRIATGEGAVWITTQHPHSALWKIDPTLHETVAVLPVPPTSRRLATGEGYVWVTSGTYAGEPGVPQTGGVLSKINPRTNRIVATIKLGFRPDGVAVANGLVWVAVAPRK
jgi:DNA-binding SARP family transcriptional activator/streptogramin lyase